MAKHKATRNRRGLLPHEYRRRSLVTVDVGLQDKPGQELHNYIVLSRRIDGIWQHQVEYQGVVWNIPGRVVSRLFDQRASIIKEERSHRARERVLAQAEAVVEGQTKEV